MKISPTYAKIFDKKQKRRKAYPPFYFFVAWLAVLDKNKNSFGYEYGDYRQNRNDNHHGFFV